MTPLLAMAATAATVAGAAMPDYAPGDAFVFSDGRVERVISSNKETVEWGGLGSGHYTRSLNPVVPILAWKFAGGAGTRTVSRGAETLWPLRPGRTARFSATTRITNDGKTRRSVALWTCEVGRPGRVRVPAGQFDVLPIRCDRYSAASMRLAQRVVWDWSPDVGHYVSRTITNYGDAFTERSELMAALPATAAPLPRLAALSREALGRTQAKRGN